MSDWQYLQATVRLRFFAVTRTIEKNEADADKGVTAVKRWGIGLAAVLLLLCTACGNEPSAVPSSTATTTWGTESTAYTTTTQSEHTTITESDSTDKVTPTESDATGSSTVTTTTITAGVTTTESRPTVIASSVISTVTTGTTTQTTVTTKTTVTSQTTVPPVTKEELRGTWLSYIELEALLRANTTPKTAAAALDAVMDNCVTYGLNTVFFIVRANSDAYYASQLFPVNPNARPLIDSGFDPLAYATEAAHKRGLSLHAWVNPYRIGADETRARCDDYFACGGRYYYIPTSETARRLILDGVREIVQNYAVDGVQFDDYFYPNGAVEATVADFERDAYTAYQSAAGKAALSVEDWRRTAVNTLVSGAYDAVHASGGVFGISPSHDAQTNYRRMYADTKRWLSEKGYVDYLCPQVYFGFENRTYPFDKTVDTWCAYERHAAVRLYFGVGLYKIGLSPDRYAGSDAGRAEWQDHRDVMVRAVRHLRKADCDGMAFYSYSYFDPAANRGLSSWTENGKTVTQTYDKAVAKEEIKALTEALLER